MGDERVTESGSEASSVEKPMPMAGSSRVPAFAGAGALPVGSCPRCAASHGSEARFCPSCRSFLAADVGRLATPKRRLAAAMLDSMFQDGGLIGSILGPLVLRSTAAHGVVVVLSAAYWVLTLHLWSKGTTPAKRALGMEVITEDGDPPGFVRMALRETIGKWISTISLGLGLLAIPFDRNHQGWHDKLFHTFVIHDDEA